jgi:hypothetical protein
MAFILLFDAATTRIPAWIAIDQGRYGDAKLDGLKMAFVFQWPGAVHHGKGKCQPVAPRQTAAFG